MEIRNQVQNHEARKWQSSAELDSILIQSCVLTPHWTMFWMGWGTTPRVPGVPSPAVGATGRDRNWCPARVINGEECPWSKQEKTDLQNTLLRVHAHACAHTRYSCHYGSFTCRFFTFVCQSTRDRKDFGEEDGCERSLLGVALSRTHSQSGSETMVFWQNATPLKTYLPSVWLE